MITKNDLLYLERIEKESKHSSLNFAINLWFVEIMPNLLRDLKQEYYPKWLDWQSFNLSINFILIEILIILKLILSKCTTGNRHSIYKQFIDKARS